MDYRGKKKIETIITTMDGVQHLKLHGWLKREEFLIKSEQIFPHGNEDSFGMFIVYISYDEFKALRNNPNLFQTIEFIEEGEDINFEDKDFMNSPFIEGIRDLMLRLEDYPSANASKKDIEKFLSETNEASLSLFKKSPEYIDSYIETPELTEEEKYYDLNHMISFFEEKERYEDCAFLVKIKEKLKIK